ncbi:dimethylarginine dimethylaminohydrolase family protein [Halobacillus massiliensis]|uniref:dimethylarginine dimethylaminohydrolase family protein n=1 Tax=Halobacillus massiliensis TaxID=1926286 RepID=UPI0009E20E0F|nr:arginine deiminase family protein [Halobacillus massiliensis]
MQTINTNSNQSMGCNTEYDRLINVLVSKPEHMKITEIINETQRHYASENIDVDTALKQHEEFVNLLQNHQVNVGYIPTHPNFNEQVFTRDIGFCIGQHLYISSLASDLRKEEIKPLIELIEEMDLTYTQLTGPSIEGGDVVINGQNIYVGISKRTKLSAAEQLQKTLPSYTIIPLELREDVLHLDCAFNIVDEKTALLFPDAFQQKDADLLKQSFECLEVGEEEQFHLGTNVLSIGSRKVISLPQNNEVNEKLREAGFEVLEVDFSEIIKSGGSFRCCTLPINRQP